MSELRWSLLILGVAFFVGLTLWELRRPRQAREPQAPPEPTRPHEPQLELPEIHALESLTGDSLPVVELLEEIETVPVLEPPPSVPDATVVGAPEELSGEERGYGAPQPEPEAPEDAPYEVAAQIVAPPGVEATEATELAEATELTEATEGTEPTEAAEPTAYLPALGPLDLLPDLPATPAPRVDWPPDEERRIVALRLVAPQPERFAGRSLRQALAAEGFVLGRFAIFHKPDEAQRAILSAASLTRPGTFDPQTMDSQHFGGLSLFAVLPGPLSPAQVFEELVATARNLNDRLCGVLQDEGGTPLTPARIASLREHLASGAVS